MKEELLSRLKKGDMLQIPLGNEKIYGLFEIKSMDINEVNLQLSSYLNFYKFEVEDKMKDYALDTFVSDAPMTSIRLYTDDISNEEIRFKTCKATLLKSFLKKRNDINIVPAYVGR